MIDMETEESIVYQLLDEMRAGGINNDELLGERDIRSWLREHRGEIIRQAFKDGLDMIGPEFQSLGVVTLETDLSGFYYKLPRIIQLPYYSGIRVTSGTGNTIPVLTRSSYYLAIKNPINKFLPKAYIEGDKLFIYLGLASTEMMNAGAELTSYVNTLTSDKQIHLECILHEPSDASDYDWTSSPYPLSGELIAMLKDKIGKNNFAIVLNTKTDEVANMKQDNIRYHDQGKVD